MKTVLRVLFGLLGGLLMLVAISACDSTPTPTPLPEATSTAVAPLSDVTRATGLRLRDDWSGRSPASPITILYTLTRAADGGFTGKVNFSVAEGTPNIVTRTLDITIPSDVAQSFLQKFTSLPIEEGVYTPAITHTDDSPLLTVTIDTPGEGTLTIYSQSQGDQHVPWGASIAGKDYVINSPAPAEAIALLDPYLKRDVRQQLIDEASKR